LLLQDLCARLPYKVKIHIGKTQRIEVFDDINLDVGYINNSYADIRPYLFPLSSMTEEQKIECFKGTDIELDEHNEIWSTFPISNSDIVLTNLNNWLKVINWLNKNHFDYRGLIPMGLALDATNLNIY
jgi:hypothetical protein